MEYVFFHSNEFHILKDSISATSNFKLMLFLWSVMSILHDIL